MSPSVQHFLAFLAIGCIVTAVVGRNPCPTDCEGKKCGPGQACFIIHNVCLPDSKEPCRPFVPVCAKQCGPDEKVCTIDCTVGHRCQLMKFDGCPNRTQTCVPVKGTACSN